MTRRYIEYHGIWIVEIRCNSMEGYFQMLQADHDLKFKPNKLHQQLADAQAGISRAVGKLMEMQAVNEKGGPACLHSH